MSELPVVDEAEVIAIRKEKLAKWREQGKSFPNDFRREDFASVLTAEYDDLSKEALEAEKISVRVAGRMVLHRVMGKASFAHIQDSSGRIQLYAKRDDLGEIYDEFTHWDMGDIIGAEGYLFKTKTNELTVHVTHLVLLTKSLRPLPDKFHGLHDTELRYRQRYVDLIANETTRHTFMLRSKIVQAIRQYMHDHAYLEVETPMLHIIPGGALAKPFETHHNALDMKMFLRIAPELFLKRCVVGGLERVFEINRNFRNEGVSTRHNPEFTMIEFYQAYATYHDLMDFTEGMFRYIGDTVMGTQQISYQGHSFDFSKPFTRLTMFNSILHYNPDIKAEDLKNIDRAREIASRLKVQCEKSYGLGKIQAGIFEETVEDKLIQPTFITEYPTEISPLARCNDDNPFVTDRFELMIGGREIANGFSELNDAEDQAARFHQQVADKNAGDEEAMHFDADYIHALEYGLPPTAGEGIGIDRLVMLFTDSASIRDVILFPHMRP